MKLSESRILMAMTSRMYNGKRQGLTISSKLMADYLEPRVKELKVVDQPLRKGWRHYPGMLADLNAVYNAADDWKPWDLFIAFDVINGLAGLSIINGPKLCYAVDDQARPHGKIVKWLYRKLDGRVRKYADFILESSPNATGMVMPSLCPPIVEKHYKPKIAPSIGYLGALEPSFGIDGLILRMPKILESVPDATLEIVGSGSQKHELVKLALKVDPSLKSIMFHGFLPDEEAVEIAKRWRVGVAPYTSAMTGIDSGKVRFYAWCGVPSVVCSNAPEMGKLVTDYGAGLSVWDYELPWSIEKMLKDDHLYEECLSGSRKLAEHFNSEPFFDSLFERILCR